jgi:hypothetical protein
MLGLPATIAWLWPCAIDVAIAQATLCLLSLNRRAPVEVHSSSDTASRLARRSRRSQASRDHSGRVGDSAVRERIGTTMPNATPPTGVPFSEDPTLVTRWTPIAEALVQQGITTKDAALVATILAQREAGMPPSTIGRAHKVHHTTVGRILSAADELTA